ncbi:MAG: hypothetical protein HY921_10225 [Elusimicrobia bacterium]|nr:hypothetical protein [Elusimicrobiota bacterium]
MNRGIASSAADAAQNRRSHTKAMLNILEDFVQEKARLESLQEATLNILDDFDVARKNVERAYLQLQAAAEELERSNTELEQFFYVASHDMQEPLRMVANYTELLARRHKDKLDPESEKFVAYIIDGATHMQELIKDLLLYARVGKNQIFGPTDCSAALRSALANLKIAIKESGGDSKVTHGPMPHLTADFSQLVSLFQNLVSNAIKYRRKSVPAAIRIEAKRLRKEWEFSVSDNGIGIDMQYANRLFLPFQRLHTRLEYPGTGIGLAICKKIVAQHGGRIWIESEPGKGTTCRFTIADNLGSREGGAIQ